MTVNLTPTQILGGLVVLLVLLWVRRAQVAADAARTVHGCCR